MLHTLSITGFSIPYILGILFMLGVIGLGIWLFKTGRYHIFYFSICAFFCLSFFIYVRTASAAFMEVESVDIAPAQAATDHMSDVSDSSYSENSSWIVSAFEFTTVTTYFSFVIVTLLSLVNPFIRQNKLAVKIISVVMLLFFALLVYVFTLLAGIGKIGG